MIVYYFKRRHIGFAIDDRSRCIGAILTGDVDKHVRDTQHVRELQLTDYNQKTYFESDTQTLYLDGLALSDLMVCIFNRRQWKSWQAFNRALQSLFGSGNGDRLNEFPTCAAAAALNIRLIGELEYFRKQMIEQHPDGFAAPAPKVLEIQFD